jgi:hypothetical protein
MPSSAVVHRACAIWKANELPYNDMRFVTMSDEIIEDNQSKGNNDKRLDRAEFRKTSNDR